MVKLLQEIEQCRKEMIELGVAHGLTSDIVVQSSKKLDHLLVTYQRQHFGSRTKA
ncbi:aspartyl-phosphate phosphatase Spo0E family protein [Ornithinibacillus gellani]|uniref:aspartyl-phosphate phosphatase Spo0E family protein n=1 Tax=Ornithinibacillus gellani TaxID=2293253 RepID=UPI000F4A3406|nr:aspartyl-phosphate phosphatase Spo0E family protein [Ornithinibacillus gellani]TQS71066.1 aspartyl-phosphate phosphatase Spo0E family protein [Ornithinibacillus gellani]